MTAYTKSDIVKPSHVLKEEIIETLLDINDKLDRQEFIVKPLYGQASDGIPYGFYTIGFSRFNLPEIYVSGIAVNDFNFNLLYPHIKGMQQFLTMNGYGNKSSSEVAMAMNRAYATTEIGPFFQVRPIDSERLLYGQAQVLRYWLDEQNHREHAKAVQIVWRNPSDMEFPIESSKNQLLLDYVPFGVPVPKSITTGVVNAAA